MVVKAGQLVEVEGWSTMGGFAPNIVPATVRVVGTGAFPKPKVDPYEGMATGREAAQWVEAGGVVLLAEAVSGDRVELTSPITGGDSSPASKTPRASTPGNSWMPK